METFYGRVMGNFRILDALATLSFDFPPGRKDRSAFFRSELEAFFVMCSREGLDPTRPKGSYAGAMGLPQFMPSSINRFAVDLDGDGHVRLHDNPADLMRLSSPWTRTVRSNPTLVAKWISIFPLASWSARTSCFPAT